MGAKTTSPNPRIVNILRPFTQHQQNGFPSLEKVGKMQKNVRESPSLLAEAKRPPQTPKSCPFLPIRPATQKTNFEHGKLKKMGQIMRETKTTPHQTLKRESLLHMHSTSQKRLPQPWRNMGKLQNREGESSNPSCCVREPT